MSWDPNTAVILYRPIDFYALATQEISKSVDKLQIELEKINKELCQYEPKAQKSWRGRKITVVKSNISGAPTAMNKTVTEDTIQKLTQILFSIQELAKKLNKITQGFERPLESKIISISTSANKLNEIAKSWLAKHQEILSSQKLFS